MKIGFDAKRLYNNFTGLGNHSRTTIDILTEYFPENAYFLYTPKIKGFKSSFNSETLNDLNPLADSRVEKYLTKRCCNTIMPNGLLKGSIWRTFGIPKNLRNDGVELFHGLSNELPVGIRKSGVPSVVTIHDVAFRTFTDMYHWQDRKIYDMKWRYAVNHADRIIAISECTKQDILRFYDVDESKIDVVYQPVAPRFYEENEECESCKSELITQTPELLGGFLLYVGSINSRKNLLGVVKAIELLPKDLQIPLVVVGGGREYKEEVKRYIAEHNMERLVIFPNNRVSDEELNILYSKAKAFVYPSFYEGFGLPVVEALLSRCPVITSNVSSLPEAGGPYSLQANPASIEDIRDKIVTVLTDDILCGKMISGGYEYAMKTFHPKTCAEKLMEVYFKLQ